MTIKEGVRLAETGLLGDDLVTAKVLSLDTVDELYDFIAVFPSEAAELFPSVDVQRVATDLSPMVTVSMMAFGAVAEPVPERRSFGALAPTVAAAEQVTRLAFEEVSAAPPGESSDEPRVLLDCLGTIRDQGSERGTCVAHTVCAMLECATGQPDLSEQWLFWMCKLNDDLPKANGTWQRVAVPLALRDGVCDEASWPYVTRATSSVGQGPPPAGAADAAMARRATRGIVLDPRWVEGICEQLDKGRVVGLSVPTYSTWAIAEVSGDIPMPLAGQTSQDGHAMCVVGYGFDDGYLGGGYLIVRNSWGTSWASGSRFSGGHGTIPFAYVRQYGWEAYAIEGPAR